MNSLNDDEFRDLPPRERRYEVKVADNLFFAVFPNGVKAWVLVYRFDGIVRRQTLGTFPDMGLARALREADKEPALDPPEQSASRNNRKALPAWLAAAGLVIVAGAGYFVAADRPGIAAPEPRAADTPAIAAVASADASIAKPDRLQGTVAEPEDSTSLPAMSGAATRGDARTAHDPAADRRDKALGSAAVSQEREPLAGPAAGTAEEPPSLLIEPPTNANNANGVPNALHSETRRADTPPLLEETAPGAVTTATLPQSPGTALDARKPGDADPLPEARRAVLALDVVDREPVGSVGDRLETPGEPRRVYFYTDVRNAAGTEILHRWFLNDLLMAERRFTVGGNYRWRVFSARDLEPGETGNWRVELRDASGRLLAERSFAYSAATARLSSSPAETEAVR